MPKPTHWPFIGVLLLCLASTMGRAEEVQETPAVLLPEKYLENVRAPLKPGNTAPDFQLPFCTFSSREKSPFQFSKWVHTKNHNGSVVVFWAFWCDTWKDVTRDLNALQPQLAEMKLQILAVSVDASQQPVARQAFEEKKIWWPVAIDEKSATSAAWGVRRVPTIFVLSKDGKVQHVYEGFPGKQTFIKKTAAVLKIAAPRERKKEK